MRRRDPLLLIAVVVLILINEPKCDCHILEEGEIIYILSGDTLIIARPDDSPTVAQKIQHLGFAPDDYRQEIVAEAYQLGGLDFLALLECENGLRTIDRTGDQGQSHGLCQLNQRWHREVYDGRRSIREFQLSVCFQKRKWGTKFYWPQRKIWGKRCWEVVKKRFYIL